ncbi:hypothetical protein JCM10213_005037 [Rhodosporidiobolus nylandii]
MPSSLPIELQLRIIEVAFPPATSRNCSTRLDLLRSLSLVHRDWTHAAQKAYWTHLICTRASSVAATLAFAAKLGWLAGRGIEVKVIELWALMSPAVSFEDCYEPILKIVQQMHGGAEELVLNAVDGDTRLVQRFLDVFHAKYLRVTVDPTARRSSAHLHVLTSSTLSRLHLSHLRLLCMPRLLSGLDTLILDEVELATTPPNLLSCAPNLRAFGWNSPPCTPIQLCFMQASSKLEHIFFSFQPVKGMDALSLFPTLHEVFLALRSLPAKLDSLTMVLPAGFATEMVEEKACDGPWATDETDIDVRELKAGAKTDFEVWWP